MRIALLVDDTSSAAAVGPAALAERLARGEARITLLPPSERAAQAIAAQMGGDFNPRDGRAVVVTPVPHRLDDEVWRALAGTHAREVDDDAAIESAIAGASHALEAGQLDSAAGAYAFCDALLAREHSPRRAEVLTRLAEIADRAGDHATATRRLDHALAIFPRHRGAVQARAELARRTQDHAAAATFGVRLLALADSEEERSMLQLQIAEDALRAATSAIRGAIALSPRDRGLKERLRAVLEARGEYSESIDCAVSIAEDLAAPGERARALAHAAELCARSAGNVGRAVALYEAAIADDPEVPGAFDAIEAVLLESRDFAGAERAYTRQLERLEGRPAAEAQLLAKLSRLCEESLGDRRGAIRALDRLVTLVPDDMDARERLAALLEANGEDALAARCLEAIARLAPARASTFQTLHRIFTRSGDADRAYAACSVLVHLGEADLDEQLTYQQYAPEVALRPSQALDEPAWDLLRPEGYDAEIESIVLALAPAATHLKLEDLAARQLLPRLDAKDRQDVERSTVTAVRAVGWVARLLGLRPPEVYVPAEYAGGIAMVASAEPALVLGPQVLSGRSLPELTFLVARELAYFRLGGRAFSLYPTLPELRNLVTAGIAIALPGSGLALDVIATRDRLSARLGAESRARLHHAVRSLGAHGGKLDLVEWLRGVERTACRVGLLASGDLNVAARVLSLDGRAIGGLSAADRLRDLIPFSVSQRYSGLRSALGVAARPSVLPA